MTKDELLNKLKSAKADRDLTAKLTLDGGTEVFVAVDYVVVDDAVYVSFPKGSDICKKSTGMSWKGNVEKLVDQFFEAEIDPKVKRAQEALSQLAVPEGYKLVIEDGKPVLKKARGRGTGGPRKASVKLTLKKGQAVERLSDGKLFKVASVSASPKAAHLKTAKVVSGDGEKDTARSFGARMFKDAE
jgi:hypothetical protein